jgi:hypothetical protein
MKATPDQIKMIIQEERLVLQEHNRHRKMLIREASRMRSQGYDQQQINEGLLDIVKGLGMEFIRTFKYDIALSLLGALGLDKRGFLARIIANVVEEMDIMDFRKYFSQGGCRELGNLIMDAVAETGVEPLADGIVRGIGIDPQGRLYVTMREYVARSILDGDLAQGIQDGISDWVCDLDIAGIFGSFKDTVRSFTSGGGGGAPAGGGTSP